MKTNEIGAHSISQTEAVGNLPPGDEEMGAPASYNAASWNAKKVMDSKPFFANLGDESKPERKDDRTHIMLPAIPRANHFLRDLRSEHFESSVVSLGLYQRKSWDCFEDVTMKEVVTKEMDWLKERVLTAFLADIAIGTPGFNVIKPVETAITELAPKVVDKPSDMKALYDERFFSKDLLIDDEIQKSLTLDAIFVACFLLFLFEKAEGTYSLVNTFRVLSTVGRNLIWRRALLDDIFILENQIPLVLLENVVSIVLRNTGPSIQKKVRSLQIVLKDMRCKAMLWKMRDFPSVQWSRIERVFEDSLEDRHQQHLLHDLAEVFSSSGEIIKRRRVHVGLFSSHVDFPEDADIWEKIWPLDRRFSRASTLVKRGVTFKGHGEFFPRFDRGFLGWAGTLYLPRIIRLGDGAEKAWRNVIAWEHGYEDGTNDKPFTNYLNMMNDLIDTASDVSHLRAGEHPVIARVGLGDNERVAQLFSTIATNTITNYSPDERWKIIFEDVQNFQHEIIGTMVGEFVAIYFSRPWLVISFIVAIIAVIATLIQTVYELLAYYYQG